MTDPQASPRRIWDGELDPEDEPATAAAAAGLRRRPDTSYRWEPARLPGPGKPGRVCACSTCCSGGGTKAADVPFWLGVGLHLALARARAPPTPRMA